MENEEIVDYLAENFRQTLKVGDNVRNVNYILLNVQSNNK